MNIEIPPHIHDLMEEVWPDQSPRRRANLARDILYRELKCMAEGQRGTPLVPFVTVPDDSADPSRKIANRIADMSPAIDDQNWAKIERNIRAMQNAGAWDHKTELLLIARLNDDFDGAENEHRVQNSRITSFFHRRLNGG